MSRRPLEIRHLRNRNDARHRGRPFAFFRFRSPCQNRTHRPPGGVGRHARTGLSFRTFRHSFGFRRSGYRSRGCEDPLNPFSEPRIERARARPGRRENRRAFHFCRLRVFESGSGCRSESHQKRVRRVRRHSVKRFRNRPFARPPHSGSPRLGFFHETSERNRHRSRNVFQSRSEVRLVRKRSRKSPGCPGDF